MKQPAAGSWLALLIAAAALFVWHTSRDLPPIVASHFGPGGAANGFMTHQFYLCFMLGFVVLLPAVLLLALARLLRSPGSRLNLPNAEYWNAEGRRDVAAAVVLGYMRVFCALLVVFLCYAHWLVVRANALSPPVLDGRHLGVALSLFLIALVSWIVLLRRAFRRLPPLPGAPR
jgi:glucose-6-phosphate-specific signal transduction histidine kinase